MMFFFATPEKKRILVEGLWSASGQLISALGLLTGYRLLTEYVPPGIFGSVSLLIGLIALGTGVFCTPILQGVLSLFSYFATKKEVHTLRDSASSILIKRGSYCILIFLIAGTIYCLINNTAGWSVLFLIGIFIVDVMRSIEITFLSAARRQQPLALWSALEAWGRPITAIFLVAIFGANVNSIMAGYFLASLFILFLFLCLLDREGITLSKKVKQNDPELKEKLYKYAFPLALAGIVAWLSGVSDRYIIGSMLSLEDVGIYAAIYGLISRPFLMLGTILELTFRPVYYDAIAKNDHELSRSLFRTWLVTIGVVGGLGYLIILFWSKDLAVLLLGKKYRVGAELMSWIAGGYCLQVLSYVFERTCYAHGRTKFVLIIEFSGAVSSVVFAIIAVHYWGLIGAAAAVPTYFGIQLVVSIILAEMCKRPLLYRERVS